MNKVRISLVALIIFQYVGAMKYAELKKIIVSYDLKRLKNIKGHQKCITYSLLRTFLDDFDKEWRPLDQKVKKAARWNRSLYDKKRMDEATKLDKEIMDSSFSAMFLYLFDRKDLDNPQKLGDILFGRRVALYILNRARKQKKLSGPLSNDQVYNKVIEEVGKKERVWRNEMHQFMNKQREEWNAKVEAYRRTVLGDNKK